MPRDTAREMSGDEVGDGLLSMGRAAAAAGLTRKALRIYEDKGLVAPARRSRAGYRLYTDRDVEVLTFIRRARALGLRLDDIGDILAIRNGGTAPCATVRELLEARIREIDIAVAELGELRNMLAQTRDHAGDRAGEPPGAVCAIIERAGARGESG